MGMGKELWMSLRFWRGSCEFVGLILLLVSSMFVFEEMLEVGLDLGVFISAGKGGQGAGGARISHTGTGNARGGVGHSSSPEAAGSTRGKLPSWRRSGCDVKG